MKTAILNKFSRLINIIDETGIDNVVQGEIALYKDGSRLWSATIDMVDGSWYSYTMYFDEGSIDATLILFTPEEDEDLDRDEILDVGEFPHPVLELYRDLERDIVEYLKTL